MSKEDAIKWHVQALAELTGITIAETESKVAQADQDPLAHLRFIENLLGKNEKDDYELLMNTFENLDIEVGDIREDAWAWCGILCRAAVISAGHPDPGPAYNRAMKWKDFGEEGKEGQPGTFRVYWTHISVTTEDGGEIGGNVGNEVKKTPPGQNWFGEPIAIRKIA